MMWKKVIEEEQCLSGTGPSAASLRADPGYQGGRGREGEAKSRGDPGSTARPVTMGRASCVCRQNDSSQTFSKPAHLDTTL